MSLIEVLIIALVLDALPGDPDWLWRQLSHPVAVIGRLIGVADRKFNTGRHRRRNGVLVILILTLAAAVFGMVIGQLPGGGFLELAFCTILLAQKSLVQHISAVARGLESSLQAGRSAVAMIVGRDANALDEDGVARSAIESAAENFSDGVVAPAFWFLLLGLPGMLVYKTVNTADSMIGYRTEKYEEFGWAAARLDDLMNWIPARIAGMVICATHTSLRAVRVMHRDAPLHRSPNAGWPEAAMAAVLGVAISGPRIYDGQQTSDPFVHAEGRRALSAADIDRAVAVLWRGWGGVVVVSCLIWLAT